MIRRENVFKIGRIGKPHGVKGEVTFLFINDVLDQVDAPYLFLEVEGILVPFFLQEYRFRSDNSAWVKFCDIDTLERARELTHCDVYFPCELVVNSAEGLSLESLTDYDVVEADTGDVIGHIKSIDEATANVLFDVVTADGQDILIPANSDLITHIDNDGHTVHMHLPQGLLEL